MKHRLLVLTAFAFNLFGACAQKTTGLHVINTFHIASPGGWDYIEVGPVNDWLYVSHGTQVNILNKNNGDSAGIIPHTTGVHGIAFDVADKKGFTSNGRLNTVTVFDMYSNAVITQIPTGQNPDAILYEPFSKKVITCNGRSKSLTIIDPVSNTAVDSVDVGGKPETAVSDNAGKLFVNIEDKNEIAVVDTRSFKVLAHWSIAPGEGPTGLAIDRQTKRLFAGCEKLLMIIDATNGSIVDKIPIGEGCDGVAFEPELKYIYTSNGSAGNISVISEATADQFVWLENIPTQKGARTITLDKQTHLIYLPTAAFEPAAPDQKGRPQMIPGSFRVIVVGK